MVLRAVPGLRHFSALRFRGLRYFCACMRAKPQFRQHFILMLLDIRAHVSARSVSDSFFFFFCSPVFVMAFFPAGSCGFWIFVACMRTKPQFRQHFIFTLFHIRAHVLREASRTVFVCFVHLVILSQPRLVGFWIFVACLRPKPQFWHQLLPNLISIRVPRAYAHQRIHAQSIITFVFQEQSITRASMPKA